ncbi:cell cycle progression protein 1 [Sphaeramia orbicularis]|uniref:Cell cycle progression 1 n=1 Tax=Sphaeramia orbicularis TaxID=375764 RepID=A0A672YFH1_9TELE|nr:cell cycle progression protein 1 [Sphaeramia orbicularis]XP_030019270.1 cell cycle progression protein 1 [Sphaeramia orbicularis]
MSETSSDAESSCGWTIISNEGSDIETLGSEAAGDFGERPPMVKPELQDKPASSGTSCSKVKVSHKDNLEQNRDEALYVAEAENNAAEKEHVSLLSSSDHSDIMTLGDVKDDDHAEVDASVHEEFYLGTSCSSQYAFTAAETVFPVQPPVVKNWSSSEDEAGGSSSPVVRRRRLRRSTTSAVTDADGEEVLESSPSDEEEEVEEQRHQEEEEAEVRPATLETRMPERQGSSVLNKCILLALIVAISMGFGHFYGTVQIQERQKTVEKIRVNELDGVKDLLLRHVREHLLSNQRGEFGLDDLDDHKVISVLTDVIEEIQKENEELIIKQAHMQAQRDDLKVLLKQKVEEKTHIMSQQQKLTADNQLLRSSLEREEKSLSILQEELKSLHSKIKDLEAMGAGADSLLSENQRLKDQLEEEKQLIRNFMGQREDLMVEAQTLRKKLDRERKVTDELRKEINELRSHISGAEKEASSEAEELQSRLSKLEKRLSFEQQRSDLWERLYVETKEERAKGDTESKVRKSKEGMAGKMKETFDAVKNSTKEFVHHHKEQIKKAKEAVKENLRKFSDSVKSTFRHFKDSASTFINKARGFYDKKHEKKESWQHRSHKHHRNPNKFDDFFQSNYNTRKSVDKVHEDRSQNTHKPNLKRCTGVFNCAYEESMNLFNKATEPIRADEFYQLLQSYVQQEVDHFHHWKELEMFINNFFHNGVFIHDQMLFTDFVSGVEDYLVDMHEYHGLDDDLFGDLDDYIYRHFFGDGYSKSYGPSGPFERPETDSKEESKAKHQQRKQQRSRSRPHSERKWSRTGRNADRHMADVKIELGPMPFDPKY